METYEPKITISLKEYNRLKSLAYNNDRKAAVLEDIANMDEDEGNEYLDDLAEYRNEY